MRKIQRLVLTIGLLAGIILSGSAQNTNTSEESIHTIATSPIPVFPSARAGGLQLDSTAITPTAKKKPGFFRRIINYYGSSNIDRTFVKKMDWSIAPGPNYSSDIGFGLGVLIAGLYRLDRTDSVTAPSNITFYGNVTTEKFVLARFAGDNFFKQNRYRFSYSGAIVYFPGAFYGVGYNDGQSGYVQSIKNTMYKLRASGCASFLPHTYAGLSLSLDYTGAKTTPNNLNAEALEYLSSEEGKQAYEELPKTGKEIVNLYEQGLYDPELADPFDHYIKSMGEKKDAMNVGMGIFAQYDTRDVITSPHKGVFLKVEAKYYPKFLGNSQESFGKITAQFNFYQKLWKGMILAYDLYSDFTLGKPSWHMYAKLGGMERMRGYYEGRYRDDNMVETQIELRQRIYRRHGVVGWFGVGNIWGHDSFRWKNTLYSFGCGYRFEFKNRMNIRLDYGWGVFGNPLFPWDNKRSSAFLFTASEAF
ncbi:MAG: hypothetical protein RR258_06390 [Alistipes sp.]